MPSNSAQQDRKNKDFFVVGIGASAGGLSALEELFSYLPENTGAAYVIIQHLSPNFKSLMKELVERYTKMKVYRVTQGMKLKPNSIFLIPPGKNLIVEANVLKLEDRKNIKHEINFPIDLFFTSLAKNSQEKAVGVILSGSGSDGTDGLKAINEVGGIALVQKPSTAQFDDMPLSAVSTGVVNQVLPIPELARLICQYVVSPHHFPEAEFTEESLLTYSNLKKIAKILLDSEKIDFSQYRTTTMARRIHRRCLINNLEEITSYIQLLNNSHEERKILCSDLLIKVTSFFRDRYAWETIENIILPKIIENAKPNTELRFWVSACSTGQEAYSLAILVYEALQKNQKHLRAKIFATDIDRAALEIASAGIYPQSIFKDISAERLQKHFVFHENSYQITKKIRELLIFSSHNLAKDAVFTRLDFVSCRNVLIYMQSNLQLQILRNFHFSLRPKGFLFLGEAESVGEYESEFTVVNRQWKIYQKQRDVRLPLTNYSFRQLSSTSVAQNYSSSLVGKTEPIAELSLKRLLNKLNSVVLIVNQNNHLLSVYGESSQILKLQQGKVTIDVTRMVKEPLQLPLSTALHRARKENQTIEYASIKFQQSSAEEYRASITVIPPESHGNQEFDFYLVEVKIETVKKSNTIIATEQFQADNDAQRRIFALEQELQHTRENLQAIVEELEASNEEQQASNEELTASNEELQTTNEELHSVNEELHTVNIEYQSKIGELIQLNNDIDNLLKSTNIGVIFLDSEFNIRKFTPAAKEAVFIRDTDLGRPLSELKLKICCEDLEQLLLKVSSTHNTIEKEVKLKTEDSYFLMLIHPYQTEERENNGLVINFVGINETKLVQLQLENTLAELKSKETEINNFFKLSLEIMCVASFDGYFKRVNPSFESILGYTTQEFMNKPFIDFVHPDDVKPTLQTVKQLSEGNEVIGFENRYRCKNGSYRWFKWMAAAYQGRIYATAHDLTEEKIAQELQNRQLAAMETATNGIAILNEDKFIYINQAHVDMFGYSRPEELLGQSWRILYESERLVEFEREIFPVLQDKGRWQGVIKAKHKNGHTFDEDLTLTFSRTGDLICVCQDISDRLEIERALIESEKKYRYLYENTPVMLHSIDNQGRILSVSNYWLEQMGYSKEEVIGKKSTDFLTPESQEHAKETLAEFFDTGSCHNVFYQWIRKNGSIIDGLLSAISEMSDGKIVRSLAVVIDITEQRQKEKLEEANQAKDRFISHMSHELRTPLNSIIGFSQMLKKNSFLNPEQMKLVNIINKSGQHLLTLINDILDLSKLASKKSKLHYHDLNLVVFLNNIVTIFDIRAQEKGLDFVTQISSDLPTVVSADETKLRQVLFNLLSNALKFTFSGSVTLSVSSFSLPTNSDSKIKTIRFEVEDTGKGIPEDKFDLIFSPFGQLESDAYNSEGTGLGLPICQNILSLMNSELHLGSKVGQGSIFWFDLDLEEVSNHTLPMTVIPQENRILTLATPCKVLVVDDNQDNRFLLMEYLQALGFTAKEAENGREGIKVALEFKPDVILVDLMMPVMDGKEMIEVLRQNNLLKNIIILVISANSSYIINAPDIKCDGFLAKPVNLELLKEKLEEHLQLDWQPDTKKSKVTSKLQIDDYLYPLEEKLLNLLKLVDFGDMDAILEAIVVLEKEDIKLKEFTQKVHELAISCQQESLKYFLKSFLKKK